MADIHELEARLTQAFEQISHQSTALQRALASARDAAPDPGGAAAAEQLQAEVTRAQEALSTARAEAEAAASDAASAKEAQAAAEAALAEAQEDAARATSALSETTETLETVKSELTELQALREAAGDADAVRLERDAAVAEAERLTIARDALQDDLATTRAQLAEQQTVTARLEAAVIALRQAADAVIENNAALRDANAQGLVEPDLINEGVQSEINVMRAERASEKAQVDSVMAALKPLLDAESVPTQEVQ